MEFGKQQLIQWIQESQSLWLLDLLENMRQNLNKENSHHKFRAVSLDTHNFKFNREEANER